MHASRIRASIPKRHSTTAKMLFSVPRSLAGCGAIRRYTAALPTASTSLSTSAPASSLVTRSGIRRAIRCDARHLSTKSRLGIGGSRLAQDTKHGDGRYASVIATSLQNGVSTFECGHGGEEELRRAYTDAAMYLKEKRIL